MAPPVVAVLSKVPRLSAAVRAASNGTISCVDLDIRSPDLAALAAAEVVLADPGLIMAHLPQLEGNCRWLSSTWAGVEKLIAHYTAGGIEPPAWRLTRFAGYFGPAMAEYVLAGILTRERHLAHYAEQQQAKHWCTGEDEAPPYRLLSALSVGVLGMGDIGAHVAKVCSLMGMDVAGLVRTVPEPERQVPSVSYYRTEQLPELLQRSDYVVNILPSTPGTRGLLDGGVLAHCKPKSSCLINVGRGDVVAEDELVRALEAGELGGAVLDVYQQEPVPETSKLWRMPGVVMTPHVAATSFADQVATAFAQNMERYTADPGSMKHVVDFEHGY